MAKNKPPGKRIGQILLDTLFYDSRVGELTPMGFRLLIELNQQFCGFNNGNLSATHRTLRFNWNDKTLKRAKKELLGAGLIEITRYGKNRRPTLYALCHLPIDECPKNNIIKRETCTHRATGKRQYFYPVRVDLQKNVREALAKAQSNAGAKLTQ